MQQGGILVSLFVDPDPAQIEASAKLKANAIEIHTGCYCTARGPQQQAELAKIAAAIKCGHNLGLACDSPVTGTRGSTSMLCPFPLTKNWP